MDKVIYRGDVKLSLKIKEREREYNKYKEMHEVFLSIGA